MLKKIFGAAGLTVAGSSFAAGVDLTSLTSAVDLSTVVPAIIAVGAISHAKRASKPMGIYKERRG
jgi:hypothetical protein